MPNNFENPYNWLNRQKPGIQGIIIIAIIGLFSFVFFWCSGLYVTCKADDLLKPYTDVDSILAKSINNVQAKDSFAIPKFDLIKNEYEAVGKRKEHHLNVAKYFLMNDYSVTITLMFLSVLGALTLFALVNRGWSGAGIKLKCIFLGIAISSLFFGLFPTVFNPKDNYTRNLNRYIDYTKLQIYLIRNYTYNVIPPLDYYSFDTTFKGNDSNQIRFISKRRFDTARYLNEVRYAVDSAYIAMSGYSDLILTMDEDKVKGIGEMEQSLANFLNTKANAAKADTLKKH